MNCLTSTRLPYSYFVYKYRLKLVPKIAVVGITRNMTGLGHFAENGILSILHFAFSRGEKMHGTASVLRRLEITVCTGLKMKQYVERVRCGLFKIVGVVTTMHLTLDHIVLNGILHTLHTVIYQEQKPQGTALVLFR